MKKFRILEIARVIPVLAVVVFWIVSCSQNRISKTPFEEVRQAVADVVVMDAMQEGDDAVFRRLYGLDPANYDGVYLLWPLSNMDAEEVLLVRLKDPGDADAVLQAIDARIATQKKSFDGYGVQQFDLLENHCVVEARGNDILFAVGANADELRQAFLGAL